MSIDYYNPGFNLRVLDLRTSGDVHCIIRLWADEKQNRREPGSERLLLWEVHEPVECWEFWEVLGALNHPIELPKFIPAYNYEPYDSGSLGRTIPALFVGQDKYLPLVLEHYGILAEAQAARLRRLALVDMEETLGVAPIMTHKVPPRKTYWGDMPRDWYLEDTYRG